MCVYTYVIYNTHTLETQWTWILIVTSQENKYNQNYKNYPLTVSIIL